VHVQGDSCPQEPARKISRSVTQAVDRQRCFAAYVSDSEHFSIFGARSQLFVQALNKGAYYAELLRRIKHRPIGGEVVAEQLDHEHAAPEHSES
jgi:hypothetical protein